MIEHGPLLERLLAGDFICAISEENAYRHLANEETREAIDAYQKYVASVSADLRPATVLAGVFVTAFYSFRMYFLVFHGKERYDQNPDAHHGGHGHDDHGHHGGHSPHESPWVVTLPLVLLAIPSVLIGFYTIEPMLFGEFLIELNTSR